MSSECFMPLFFKALQIYLFCNIYRNRNCCFFFFFFFSNSQEIRPLEKPFLNNGFISCSTETTSQQNVSQHTPIYHIFSYINFSISNLVCLSNWRKKKKKFASFCINIHPIVKKEASDLRRIWGSQAPCRMWPWKKILLVDGVC